MRKPHRRYGASALLTLLALLLAAGPALAGGPFAGMPPGSQWGGHDVNAKIYITDALAIEPSPFGEYVNFRMVADEACVSGTLEVWSIEFATSDDGNMLCSGPAVLTPDAGGGTWSGEFSAVVSSGIYIGKPYQHLIRTFALVGSGAYDRAVFSMSCHTAYGPVSVPWIVKGWIGPAE